MKAWELSAGCTGLDGLKLVDRPQPQPGPREILVRMRAASLNYRDLAIISGRYFGGAVARPTIPLSCGAGEVVAVGVAVTRFKVGDRASGAFFHNWIDGLPRAGEARPALGSPLDGTLTELAIYDQNDAVHIPPSLTFEQAATLPCAGVTAWNALMVQGRPIKPGDIVLVLGTGGVSMLALQFARAAGARVIATSSSDDKLKRAQALGAADGINYKTTPKWADEVMKVTGGHGADCVVEVGGLGTLGQSMQAVAMAGKVCLIGVLTREGDSNPHVLMTKGAALHGIFVGNRAMYESLNAAIEANGIKPVVDRVFLFDQAHAAYEHLRSQSHFGKVVISI